MNKLRQLRQYKKMTLSELSKDLKKKENIKLSSDAIAKYERGVREPKIEIWQKLAKYFGVSTTYLIGISNINSKYDLDNIDNFIAKLNEYSPNKKEGKKEFENYKTENSLSAYEHIYKAFLETPAFVPDRIEHQKIYNKLSEEFSSSNPNLDSFDQIYWLMSQFLTVLLDAQNSKNGLANDTVMQVGQMLIQYSRNYYKKE